MGLTAAAILAVTACFCTRRIRTRNKKVNLEQNNISFQPTRRPTAVRSPSGQPPHYLKKSPSPTATKPLPGSLLSPVQSVKYSEENEVPKNITTTTDIDGYGADTMITENGTENGKLGALVFKLRYLADRNALVVSVVRCRGLPEKQNIARNGDAAGGLNGKIQTATDPYVKLQLLPEKQHKVKTRYKLVLSKVNLENLKKLRKSTSFFRVVRNTRNPVYDEDFTFYGLSLAELSLMSLHFVILSFDRYSRDDVIGEVVCPLSGIDLSQIENQQVALSKEIQPRSLKVTLYLFLD